MRAILERFTVYDPQLGAVCTNSPSKIVAFDLARAESAKRKGPMQVFDHMAHFGEPAVWSVDLEGYKATHLKMHKPGEPCATT
jgi:hypothetical protein